MDKNLLKFIFATFLFLCVGTNNAFTPSYFFMTTEFGKIPLFAPGEEYQKIVNTKLAAKINPGVKVSPHCLKLSKDIAVNFNWYQGGKSELIILALGKGGRLKEKLPYIHEFTKHYDVIVFDYEWQNPAPLYRRMTRIATPLKRYFERNYLEIQAVVNYARKQGKYRSIIGHAECYSAFMFVKAQALATPNQPLFDKLILDSCLLSGKNAVKSLLKNPALCANPLDGESSALVKFLSGNRLFLSMVDACSGEYSIQKDFTKLDIPILFIRGNNDTMVHEPDFNLMWSSVTSQKAAFITPYHHVDSFRRKNARKEYLYMDNLFIKNTFDDFTKILLETWK